jgi:hypothetical protein
MPYWFPDGAVDRANLPMNCRRDMTLGAEGTAQAPVAIQRAFQYWHRVFAGRKGLGSDAENDVRRQRSGGLAGPLFRSA